MAPSGVLQSNIRFTGFIINRAVGCDSCEAFQSQVVHINCGVIMIFPHTSGESPAAVGKTVS